MNIMKSFCHVRFLFTPITLPLFKCCLELGCSSWQSACLATRPLVWSQHQKKQSSYFWFIYSIFTCSLLSYPGNGDIEASGVSGGFPVLLLFSAHHQWKTCGTPKVLQDFSPWWWGHNLRLSLALTHFFWFFFLVGWQELFVIITSSLDLEFPEQIITWVFYETLKMSRACNGYLRSLP